MAAREKNVWADDWKLESLAKGKTQKEGAKDDKAKTKRETRVRMGES